MPGKKYKERKRICVSLPSIVLPEVSHISRDDCFAAMQIDLCVQGWIGAFATTSRLKRFPSVPELCHFRLIRLAAICANLLSPKTEPNNSTSAARKQSKSKIAINCAAFSNAGKTRRIRGSETQRCRKFNYQIVPANSLDALSYLW